LALQAGAEDELTKQFWDKEIVAKEREGIKEGRIEHKRAELFRGFLVYVSRTYKSMVPYLKGLHLHWGRALTILATYGTDLVNQFGLNFNLVNPFGLPTISTNLVIQFGQVQFGHN
jgi:hypothetical protein